MIHYEKLVRDKIPEILDSKGVFHEKRVASPEEYRHELVKKLGEETQEFIESAGSVEELADVIEVIEALKKLPEYGDVERVRATKRDERGAFEKRLIVTGEK